MFSSHSVSGIKKKKCISILNGLEWAVCSACGNAGPSFGLSDPQNPEAAPGAVYLFIQSLVKI